MRLTIILLVAFLAATPRTVRQEDSLRRARMAEYYVAGDQEACLKAARELIDYHREKNNDRELFNAYATLFEQQQGWGRFDDAVATLEEMSALAQERRSALGAAVSEFCFGQLYLGNRQPQQAQGHYRRAFRQLLELGENGRALRAGFNLQAVAMNLDAPEDGLAINDSTQLLLERMERDSGRMAPTNRLKQTRYRFVLLQRLGRMEEASALKDTLLHYAALMPDASQDELVLTAIAQFEQQTGNKEAAYAALDTLINRHLRNDNYAKAAQFRLALADFQRENRDYDQAVDSYRQYAVENDSAQVHLTNRQLNELTQKYRLNELNMEHQAQREHIRAVAVAIILLLVLVFGSIYIRSLVRHRKKDEERIASLQEAGEKVRRADAAKERFIQNMTHELRTPLNAITGFSQLLALPDGTFSPEEKEEFGHHVMNGTRMMTMMLDDLISSSDMDSGGYKVRLEDAECGAICREAVTTAEHRLQPGVQLLFEPSIPLPFPLRTDPLRVQQVLANLLTNACKHTASGTIRLDCSTALEPGMLAFIVEDTGTGIPPEEAERIFERFVKLDDFVQGTGLGLSICRDIVTRLGGRIWLDTAYTGGARFVFTVPLS